MTKKSTILRSIDYEGPWTLAEGFRRTARKYMLKLYSELAPEIAVAGLRRHSEWSTEWQVRFKCKVIGELSSTATSTKLDGLRHGGA